MMEHDLDTPTGLWAASLRAIVATLALAEERLAQGNAGVAGMLIQSARGLAVALAEQMDKAIDDG